VVEEGQSTYYPSNKSWEFRRFDEEGNFLITVTDSGHVRLSEHALYRCKQVPFAP
jgi:hypothetical protein